ncbi:serine protease [Lacimicrobium sp. SS2-24]|uniref:S1 family peptidase n=1 Tax=Lacimicrobium sp. SS2-24 TaxID=2005569 RepID=UPI000B4B3BDF|nr:serine protease [Lacimicrobium sp. SS2-24]
MLLSVVLPRSLILGIVSLFFTLPSVAQENARELFGHYQSALFQIRMIEVESGNKSSIGSGFQVSADGLMVTNYHVIADKVFYPEKYRIEYLTADGESGLLSLQHIDVVNDLALVRRETQNSDYLPVAPYLPAQGDNIYSLGNPHDLGMIVVPGTFNGLKKNSFNQKIHFTGSINPGMSGGPTVDALGQVVGVNVATAGNQIGFLVPLARLRHLLARAEDAPPADFIAEIEQQLLANQSRLLEPFIESSWPVAALGRANVAAEVVNFLPCWGNSNANDKEARYLTAQKRCRLEEEIYLNNKLRTGSLEIEYEWISSDSLSDAAFYNLYEQSLQSAGPGNNSAKEFSTNYQCEQQRVYNQQGMKVRLLFCIRAYKDFEQLYDVLMLGASYDQKNQGLISHFTLAGVSRSLSLAFTKRFMEAMAWQ